MSEVEGEPRPENAGDALGRNAEADGDEPPSPLRLLVFTVLAIFSGEAFVMLLFVYLPVDVGPTAALLDAVVLSLFIGPILMVFLYLPMRESLERQRRVAAELRRTVGELSAAAAQIRTLKGIVPICSYCKKIRDDEGFWKQVEVYVRDHSEAEFSHGICPECLEKHVDSSR